MRWANGMLALAWGALGLTGPARIEGLRALVAEPVVSQFDSLKKVRLSLQDLREGDEATLEVAYKALGAERNVERLIHLPWASFPRGGPPAKLAEWLRSINATMVQPLLRQAVHAGSAVAGFWVYPPGHGGTGAMRTLPGSHEAIGRAFTRAEEEWSRFYRDNVLTGDPRFVVLGGSVERERLSLRVRNAGPKAGQRFQGPVRMEGARDVRP